MKRVFRDLWLQRCTDGSFTCVQNQLINTQNHRERCCLSVALHVASELDLLPLGSNSARDGGTLKALELNAIGMTHAEQDDYANANDKAELPLPEGQYYPDAVLELMRNQPLED